MKVENKKVKQMIKSVTGVDVMDRKRAPVFWGGGLVRQLEIESNNAEGISLSLTQSSLNGSLQSWGARGAQF